MQRNALGPMRHTREVFFGFGTFGEGMLIAAWCNEFIWRIKKIFIFAKCHKMDYILLFYLSTEFKHGTNNSQSSIVVLFGESDL